jgi:uncharacterized repeat protein (TIGR02059 family)
MRKGYPVKISLNRSNYIGNSGRNLARTISLTLTASLLFSGLSLFTVPSANAAPVTATGTNPSVCNQEVGNALNVVAYRLSGGDCVIEFKNSGSTTWTPSAGISTATVLVIAGGGGGSGRHAGGGGAGGFIETTTSNLSGEYTIVVGAGGSGSSRLDANSSIPSTRSQKGGNSSVSGNNISITSVGGGAGAGRGQPELVADRDGGSGGGSDCGLVGCPRGTGTAGQGFDGGQGVGGEGLTWSGGGGGGAGAAGETATSGVGGNGGAGKSSSISGGSVTHAGGGGGATFGGTRAGSGGSGGGGNGGNGAAGSNATGFGSGGGGGGHNDSVWAFPGGNGSSGIVIIRYTPDTTAPTVSTVSSTSNGSFKAGDLIDIRVTFSETVTVTGTPQITLETGAIDRTVNYSSGSGSTVLLFNYTVQAGDTSSDLDYVATNSLALNGGTIADVTGNNATLTLASPGASGSLGNSKAIVIDTTAPTFSSAVLNSAGTQITLTYSETLSTSPITTSRFTVSDSGTAVTVSSVPISGSTITLSLASVINSGRVVTLSYTDPTVGDDLGAIQDFVGNDAASLSSQNVTNNSTVKSTPTFSAWSNVTKTFGDANYTVTAPTVTGSIPGSFSYSSSNTGVISISGTTFTVQGGGSATITATFTPTDLVNYNTATTTNTVTVNKAAQTAITITTTTATYGSTLTLASTGGSTGGTYSYTLVSGDCTLSGAVLTPTATGSCVVQSSLATNANYLAETSTETTITISSGTVSASLTLAPGNLVFRQAKNITAVATVAGKITFRVAGKVLPGCKNKTVNAGNSFTAICSYRPSNHSYVTITATLNPDSSFYVGTVTNSAQYLVTRRTGPRS